MKIKRHKKASLSLSINAIVVLIIAIAVLGLILGFTKGMFSTLQDKIEGMAADEPDAPEASSGTPLTVSRTSVVGKTGSAFALKFGIYNPAVAANSATAEVKDSGTAELTVVNTCSVLRQSSGQTTISGQESGQVYVVLTMPATAGPKVCTFDLHGAGSTVAAPNIIGSQDVLLTVK